MAIHMQQITSQSTRRMLLRMLECLAPSGSTFISKPQTATHSTSSDCYNLEALGLWTRGRAAKPDSIERQSSKFQTVRQLPRRRRTLRVKRLSITLSSKHLPSITMSSKDYPESSGGRRRLNQRTGVDIFGGQGVRMITSFSLRLQNYRTCKAVVSYQPEAP